jgi:2-polyprenyl-3-methyl-5-hydroxy-6-metoxy-1,4-benzoquinol methylase
LSDLTLKLQNYPNLSAVVDEVLRVWPEHQRYCETRFKADKEDFLARTEEFSALACVNMGDDLTRYVEDYRWMCERFLEEEIHFQRTGEYRLSTFQAAFDEVYSDLEYMSRYVRGILISQIIWDPHARAFDAFRQAFLPTIPEGGRYLEVGPGHGLFLYFASREPKLASLEAWDVSDASIAETHSALHRLGVEREISIVQQDVLKAPARHNEFDAAVISEVLEHLERPDLALQSLNAALKPGGRIFINAPINSPAPDHIYLWRSIEEFHSFVEAQGFSIDAAFNLPVTGYTLERAIKHNVSISCVVIARKV